MENEEGEENHRGQTEKKSSFVIKIPSFQEVLQTSQSQQAPPSLFAPSPSFSQAFSFVKKSEFYTPPPALPPTSSSTSSTTSRPLDQSGVPSSSAAASASSTTQNAYNRNAILVSHRQKGNPLLKHIRNAKWAFADIVCDYQLGQSSCALYLSLRYHLLHPDYLYYRIRELQKNFKLRVVLCHVDVEDVVKPLLEVTKTALLHDCTLLCGWSLEECGRYLETIKVYENKPADLIQGQTDSDYLSRINHALTSVRHVNKTDVVTLGSTFGSLSSIMDASMEDLARCPGIGERKVKRLHDTFHEPFKRSVPKSFSVPQTSTQNNIETSTAVTAGKEDAEDQGRDKIEPQVSIKSALTAAFAKYSDKIAKTNSKSPRKKKKTEESSSDLEAKANDRNNIEEATD